jgi:hypothetical protein
MSTSVLALSMATQLGVGVASAACNPFYEHHLYEEMIYTPSYNADGVRAYWQIRSLANSYASTGGATTAAVWFQTDQGVGAQDWWVEVGVTSSWEGVDGDVFYSAHWAPGDEYKQQQFLDLSPIQNHYAEFKIIKTSAGSMKPSVTDVTTDIGTSRLYNGHSGPFPYFHIGGEATCTGTGALLDKTYVYNNDYRKVSDDAWVHPVIGTPNADSRANSGVDPCVGVYLFKFYINDPTNSGCS